MPERGLLGALGPQFLQGDVAAEVAVVGQPDAADAAGGVQAEPGVALGPTGNVVDGRHVKVRSAGRSLRRASAGCRRRRGRPGSA